MVRIDTTTMSSRGQIVVPQRMRNKFKEGDVIVVIENENQLILKKESQMDKALMEDIKFARETEEAWKEIEAGKGIKSSVEDFLKEIRNLK